jgi:hypothetical protein
MRLIRRLFLIAAVVLPGFTASAATAQTTCTDRIAGLITVTDASGNILSITILIERTCVIAVN